MRNKSPWTIARVLKIKRGSSPLSFPALKRKKFLTAFGLLFLLPCAVLFAEPPTVKEWIAKGDQSLEQITEQNAMEAAKSYEKALELDPNHYEANWKAARAYVLMLDFKTNALIVEKDEYKPALRDLGAKAEAYAERAYRADPKGLDGLVWYTGSYAYHAASMGIVTAVFKGAGEKLKKLSNELVAADDGYHGAFGYRMLGRFYLNAPFPVGSKKKAMEYFEKATQKDSRDLENHYFLGVAYAAKNQVPKAKMEFEFVRVHPPLDIEAHLADLFKQAAKEEIDKISQLS